MAQAEYDVFISFKNLDEHGVATPDSTLAAKVHDFLVSRGLRVFFSNVTLEQLGVSAYKRAIDDALDGSRILVAVGTSPENLDWQWVRYEWDSFFSDILSGVKPEGRVFVYLDGPDIRSLPRALRQSQAFHDGPEALGRLFNFVSSALGQRSVPPTGVLSGSRPDPRQKESSGGTYVAYSSADERFVEELSGSLRTTGIPLPRKEDIPAGSDFVARVLGAIRQASVVVVVLSTGSVKSSFVQNEVMKAMELQKPILPVLIDDVRLEGALRYALGAMQYIDARNRSTSDVALDVAAAINRLTTACS